MGVDPVSVTPTKFGRYAVAEPFRAATLHLWKGEEIKAVDWEPPIPVLDQEDLLAQGIRTSELIPGAQDVDALGSCVCNAGTASLAERFHAARGRLPTGISATDSVANECFAIELYHATTDLTGDPSQEWPPTDCGSTSLYVCTGLQRRGLISSYKSAATTEAVLSLLQTGTVIIGSPFFNAWMEPDVHGFVDGGGFFGDFQRTIESGVAGGHETCLTAIESVTPGRNGTVDQAVIRVRNSWNSTWGDQGSYRLHLTTLRYLGANADFKQFIV